MPTDTDEDRGPDGELPPWMQADDDWHDTAAPAGRIGRGRLLAVIAAIPWLVALLLVVRSGGAGAGPGAPPEPTATAPETATPDAAVPASVPTAAGTDSLARITGTPPPITGAHQPRVTVTGADAVAMATAVARAWITGVGPVLGIDGLGEPGPLYAEHLVAEAIDHPSPGLAVVTLLGVVLHVEDGAYSAAEVRRIAVPVALDAEGARPAGAPWWLPSPEMATTEVSRTTVDDPDLAIEAAMAAEAAGYRDVELLDLAVTDSWPLIATLRAIAPGQTDPRQQEVWMRPHLDGLVVAGWLPPLPDSTEERP